MGQGASSAADVDVEQFGGAEELAEIDAKAVSTVGGARRRAGGRAKTHKAPSGRRNKTRKAK